MNLITRRAVETIAILLIGDGVVGASNPQRHARLWLAGPPGWRRAMALFVERPGFTRALSALEAGLGIWLASRAEAGSSASICPQARARSNPFSDWRWCRPTRT